MSFGFCSAKLQQKFDIYKKICTFDADFFDFLQFCYQLNDFLFCSLCLLLIYLSRYNAHVVGGNELSPGSYDGDPFERLMPGNLSVSAEQVVYRKVCIELLQELFDALPKKDRDILGKFYGVFGFEKTSLKEIGMYHMMKESAVEKAKERAVTKLKKPIRVAGCRFGGMFIV